MPLNLSKVPPGYPVSWVYVPRTRGQLARVYHRKKATILCDVQECLEIPKYEIFFGAYLGRGKVYGPYIRGVTDSWWYVCKEHKEWLWENSKKKKEA